MSVTGWLLRNSELPTRAGGRFAAALLSFVETAVFFGIVTPAFVVALPVVVGFVVFLLRLVVAGIRWGLDLLPGLELPASFPALPALVGPSELSAGMWIVVALGYLLLLALYWAPPKDETLNRAQVAGLVLFLVAALAALALWQWDVVAEAGQTFAEILKGGPT